MEPLKNLLSFEAAEQIVQAIQRVHPRFDRSHFLKGLQKELEPLELKARMQHLADRLEALLPTEPNQLFPILTGTLAENEQDTEGLQGFILWPLSEIIARRGEARFDLAMTSLREMTSRFTSEYAIRPFLLKQPERTLPYIHQWSEHPNEHVRRLASEGTRPLLPWGERLPHFLQDPAITLPILNRLHHDPSEYVRRSVANHLNDYSKVHPQHIISTLRQWHQSAHPAFASLANKAARTLIKQGHPEALALIGFTPSRHLVLEAFTLLDDQVPYPGTLHYQVTIRNQDTRQARAVLFDYAIHHRKANGQLTRKVFKGRKARIDAGGSWTLEGKHTFRPISTRVYYPGEHRIEPLLNGIPYPPLSFQLG